MKHVGVAKRQNKAFLSFQVVILLTAGWSIPAKATDGDFLPKGIQYCADTYTKGYRGEKYNHPSWFGSSVVTNVNDINFPKDNGTVLNSPADGYVIQVTYSNRRSPWGNSIIWKSLDGTEQFHLAHLSRFGKTGKVRAGDDIGAIGTTGNSTNPHLHISRAKNGSNAPVVLSGVTLSPAINPASYGRWPCNSATYTSKGPLSGGKLPDFVTEKIKMTDLSGVERSVYKINETATVRAWIDNTGDADWEAGNTKDKIKVSFFLSKGSDVDNDSEWVLVSQQNIQKTNLKVSKNAKQEAFSFSLAQWANAGYISPGKYNFVACADYPKVTNNGSGDVKEKSESNNCSKEAVFTVKPLVYPDLTASSLQLKSGATTLNGGGIYGLSLNVQNIGQNTVSSSFQIRYEIKGPETGGAWKLVADSTFNAVPLAPGAEQQYSTSDSFAAAPTVEGDYLLRACVDSKQVVAESNEGNNCSEDMSVYVSPASEFLAKPVYRFWSSEQASHFYTISEAEKDRVIAIYTPYQWRYERVEGCALPSQEDDSLPVYRFYSSPLTLHRFTILEEEKDSLMAMPETFKYEGIAWYAYTYQKDGTVPMYRFYSETYKSYFYTISEAERDLVIEKYPDEIWRYDGIAWYVFECP